MARARYVEPLRDSWLPEYEDRSRMVAAARHLCQTGDPAPLCDFIESRLFRVLSNRDYRWTNELLVKFAFLTQLFDDRLNMAVSELVMAEPLRVPRGLGDGQFTIRRGQRTAALPLTPPEHCAGGDA